MSADFADPAEQIFRDLLAAALASGRRPGPTAALGPASWVAIDAVAREHPYVTPDQVIAACDAFAMEHAGGVSEVDPLTARAAEYAAIDALISHLTISYPNIEPQTVTAIVRRIHADFHDHAVRDFIPLFVEHAALRQFGHSA